MLVEVQQTAHKHSLKDMCYKLNSLVTTFPSIKGTRSSTRDVSRYQGDGVSRGLQSEDENCPQHQLRDQDEGD